jgi:hypothetical protein
VQSRKDTNIPLRHCERSEGIQRAKRRCWIASLRSQ